MESKEGREEIERKIKRKKKEERRKNG